MIDGTLSFPQLVKMERGRYMRRGEYPSGARLLKETLALLLGGFRHERDAVEYLRWAEDWDCFYTPHGDPMSVAALRRALELARKYPHYSPF